MTETVLVTRYDDFGYMYSQAYLDGVLVSNKRIHTIVHFMDEDNSFLPLPKSFTITIDRSSLPMVAVSGYKRTLHNYRPCVLMCLPASEEYKSWRQSQLKKSSETKQLES